MAYKITRSNEYEYETRTSRVSWLDSFAENYKKQSEIGMTAVEISRKRDQDSKLQMITNIISGKTNQNVLEAKIQQLQERVGLNEYLKRATASEKVADLPEDLRTDLEHYIKNLVESHRGALHIPAITQDLLSTFRQRGLKEEHINDPELAKFINYVLIEHDKNNPTKQENYLQMGKDLGQIDDSNKEVDDMFVSLTPTKD